ncbi:MAG: ATP-binding cassette domain-containing protein [Streptosporangiaceae bacterium]|nr:ATP-binding cassette domain-containing protein [Streptosporangiaceae bacterium]MBV9852997.1 ATP-binding cassette domain-containing protein [Streptosporangiaceae bacterium]
MTVPQRQQPAEPAVEAIGIHKRFGSTYALRGVDLSLSPGRCLGLVGRNGAGKSTLVSILAGILPPDAGQVRLGAPIATVFQHSMVVPSLTVAENVFLGSPPRRGGLVDWRAMRAQARKVMSEWGFDVNADAPCASLTVEQRQIVEIARALAAGTRCLLLDEPTAALERGAVQRLFERIRQLRGLGVAVLYISHHLEEVFEICTEAAVLRDGEMVLTAPLAGLGKDDLVTAMVGAERAVASPHARSTPARGQARPGTTPGAPATPHATATPGKEPSPDAAASPAECAGEPAIAGQAPHPSGGAPALTVTDITLDSPGTSLRGVSLTVRRGERLGITGLRGSGATTLARIVAGATAPDAGTVRLGARVLRPGDRAGAMRAGVGYIPEDRQADGFVPLLGVAENITFTIVDRLARFGIVPPRAREARAAPLARRLSIVSAGLGQPVGELSGGNQQKVTVARALARDPELIVAVTPTRGVDVASKELLLAELDRVTSQTGATLLLASDELDDLVICDRVVVLVRGEIFTEFTDPPFNREALIAATEGLEAAR